MGLSLAVLLALAAGVFGRAQPLWGGALLVCGALALWGEVRSHAGRCLCLGALCAMAAAAWLAAAPLTPSLLPLDRELRFRGVVAEDPTRTQGGTRVFVDVGALAPPEPGPWQAAGGRVALLVEGEPVPKPGLGDQAIFRAALRPPWGLRNPGGSGFSHYLARKGVAARASARWPGEVVFARPGPGTPSWLQWRRDAADAMAAVLPGQEGAVLAALTLGDWSRVLPETSESFRQAGTTHLLAISGLHLGILALLVLPPIRWALVRVPGLALRQPVEPLARLLVLPILTAYAGIAGFQASTLRSLAMAALLVAAGALSRPVAPLGVLVAALAVLAVLSPPALGDPGLQLSAVALAALFWLAPRAEARLAGSDEPVDPLEPPRGEARRWAGILGVWARRMTLASLAASLATAPVAAFHFGSSSLLGLAFNPLAVPLVEFFCLPIALAGTALRTLWSPAGDALWRLSGVGLGALLRVQAAVTPGSPLLTSPALESPAGCLGALALLAAVGLALEKPPPVRRALAVAAAGAAALAGPLAAGWLWSRFDTRTHLWALDVAHGQALVLRAPPDHWVLVDAGGFPGSDLDTGARVVVPALRALGARQVQIAVSTHPHPDHVLGLASAVRLTRPARLWLPASFFGDPRYGQLLESAASVGTSVEWIGPSGIVRRESLGAASLEAVWMDGPSENDRSLVLRLVTSRGSALLPADLQFAGQAALLATDLDLRSDLLVAPHHGSAGAVHVPFLEAVRPSVVFVSASGRLSLPSPAFLGAVDRLPAAVHGTFREGCLHAVFTPRGLETAPPAR